MFRQFPPASFLVYARAGYAAFAIYFVCILFRSPGDKAIIGVFFARYAFGFIHAHNMGFAFCIYRVRAIAYAQFLDLFVVPGKIYITDIFYAVGVSINKIVASYINSFLQLISGVGCYPNSPLVNQKRPAVVLD